MGRAKAFMCVLGRSKISKKDRQIMRSDSVEEAGNEKPTDI